MKQCDLLRALGSVDIVDLAKRFIPELAQDHDGFWIGKCPKCGRDKLSITRQRQHFYCFGEGCDFHGSAIDLVASFQGLSFDEACEWMIKEFCKR